MGRPIKHDRRAIVNAIFYVAATGCQWRHLPATYPHWNTVHCYHVTWSRDGTWEKGADRLRELVRSSEGRDPDPSAGIIDARSVRGTPTVTSLTRGYDAGKKISGRKVFGLVDTIGLLLGVTVMVASTSDNVGGIAVFDSAREKSERLKMLWVDSGFKNAFVAHCRPGTLRLRSCGVSIRTRSLSYPAAGLWNEPGPGPWQIGVFKLTMNVILK